MDEHDADLMAKVMTECYASTQGCKRMPVRMLTEIVNDGTADAQFVMMCIDHAKTYKPEGKVVDDRILVDDKNLKFFTEHGL